MYPVSTEVRELFAHSQRQAVTITLQGLDGETVISEEDIIQGGLSVNRYCVSGDRIEVGSAVAAELSLQLTNADGRFNETRFEGAELYVTVGVENRDKFNITYRYVPLGYFTVDEAPRKLEAITLTALDRMVLFDKPADAGALSFPMTAEDLLSRICDICNVIPNTDLTLYPNYDYSITSMPEGDNLTYRQLLSWISELTGTCAYIDWEGHLVLGWYSGTDIELSAANRFTSDLKENPVEITGVRIKQDENAILVGTDDYAINIEGNNLIRHDAETVAENLFGSLGGFSYTPFTATVQPMPYVYPLDIVTFVDKDGGRRQSIVTNVTFSVNANTAIEGKGETATNSGYASANPLTRRESAIIEQLKQQQNETLNDRLQSALAFNELISNALGLYVTPVKQPDGSVIYYLHDNPRLEDSKVIFTMTAGGIAWTNQGWNGGSPVWSYGATAAGDALFRMLSAEGIEVSKVGEDYSIEITPKAFRIYYRNMLVTNIEADAMTIPKANFTNYSQWGRIRLTPYKDEGANLIFTD